MLQGLCLLLNDPVEGRLLLANNGTMNDSAI
ncbi:hypothetical protein AciX8_4763 [Granulicella mallensis MP5ACTX8]|uniref:Uncharacterized protein n=1 Tax=Granulicella mallensis (strain ATCC BAA-1857 / DSM 23137 / MP5ACTX8) TaxID=682795 RepID=G8NXN7_GRAMM|nr:hypothetical protein AciX8_4763 [Granulicella mallensis MP5ACTX8]